MGFVQAVPFVSLELRISPEVFLFTQLSASQQVVIVGLLTTVHMPVLGAKLLQGLAILKESVKVQEKKGRYSIWKTLFIS